jgi:ubiquinone/menaquinone biosynthesis C-methylase UbiE
MLANNKKIIPGDDDFLKQNLADLPYFRALLRAEESRFYSEIPIESPVLDLGCGDGHFAHVTFKNLQMIGVDSQHTTLVEARKTNSYQELIHSTGQNLPFKAGVFKTCISNSVLEHIEDIEPVLQQVARILEPNGLFVFCVPNQNFTKNLSIAMFFEKMRLNFIANSYRVFFNRISRHFHCDSELLWEKRLKKAGFSIIDQWEYFSPAALRALEWGHYLGFPYLISKMFFSKWILCPALNQNLLYPLLKKYYFENSRQKQGSYSFFITRKI